MNTSTSSTSFDKAQDRPLTTSKLSASQKGFSPLFILFGIILAIGVVGGAYYLGIKNSKPEQSQPVTVNQNTPQPTQNNNQTSTTTTSSNETSNWKTYTITPDPSLGYESYEIKLPTNWKQIEHSSNFQGTETFLDNQNTYRLTIGEQKNYNNQTGKQFATIDEYVGLPYKITVVTIDGQEGRQPLPRAGGENINSAVFFSKDSQIIYTIKLQTGDTPLNTVEAKIEAGQRLFKQILSTFKFTQ